MAKNTRKDALGQGIRALLGNINLENDSNTPIIPPSAGNVADIGIDEIEANPYQPRMEFDQERLRDLADSIRIHGVIQPITVRWVAPQQYQLIAGERRWRASRLAGLTTLPAYVRTANDQEMLEMALIENIQRENLNPIEIALNYQRLLSECNLTHNDLAIRLGKGRTTITNFLRLLKLPPDIQAGIRLQQISMGHARALIEIDEVEAQLSIYKQILENEWSVRQVENAVKQWRERLENKKTPLPPIEQKLSVHLRKVQDNLESHFGTRVTVKQTADGKGQIAIGFGSDEELNRILDLMQ